MKQNLRNDSITEALNTNAKLFRKTGFNESYFPEREKSQINLDDIDQLFCTFKKVGLRPKELEKLFFAKNYEAKKNWKNARDADDFLLRTVSRTLNQNGQENLASVTVVRHTLESLYITAGLVSSKDRMCLRELLKVFVDTFTFISGFPFQIDFAEKSALISKLFNSENIAWIIQLFGEESIDYGPMLFMYVRPENFIHKTNNPVRVESLYQSNMEEYRVFIKKNLSPAFVDTEGLLGDDIFLERMNQISVHANISHLRTISLAKQPVTNQINGLILISRSSACLTTKGIENSIFLLIDPQLEEEEFRQTFYALTAPIGSYFFDYPVNRVCIQTLVQRDDRIKRMMCELDEKILCFLRNRISVPKASSEDVCCFFFSLLMERLKKK